MADIYVGDNGVVIEINLFDSAGPVNLQDVTAITALFVRGDRTTFPKTFTVDDAETGVCSTELLADDLKVPGKYSFQVKAAFSGGGEYSGKPIIFTVMPRLSPLNHR